MALVNVIRITYSAHSDTLQQNNSLPNKNGNSFRFKRKKKILTKINELRFVTHIPDMAYQEMFHKNHRFHRQQQCKAIWYIREKGCLGWVGGLRLITKCIRIRRGSSEVLRWYFSFWGPSEALPSPFRAPWEPLGNPLGTPSEPPRSPFGTSSEPFQNLKKWSGQIGWKVIDWKKKIILHF